MRTFQVEIYVTSFCRRRNLWRLSARLLGTSPLRRRAHPPLSPKCAPAILFQQTRNMRLTGLSLRHSRDSAVCYNRYMEFIGSINTSYYCERHKPNGPILVLVTGAYRVAEFDVHTGNLKWHRVVAAPQRTVIEGWLNVRFPQTEVAIEAAARKKVSRAALAAV